MKIHEEGHHKRAYNVIKCYKYLGLLDYHYPGT